MRSCKMCIELLYFRVLRALIIIILVKTTGSDKEYLRIIQIGLKKINLSVAKETNNAPLKDLFTECRYL